MQPRKPASTYVARLEQWENRTFLGGAPGSIDTTFGNAGIAASHAPAFAGANGMAVESNGSIVLGLNDGTAVVIF